MSEVTSRVCGGKQAERSTEIAAMQRRQLREGAKSAFCARPMPEEHLTKEHRERMTLATLLAGLADRARQHAALVVVVGLLTGIIGGFYAAHHLGISTDTDAMFPSTLPWRQKQIAIERAFPQFRGLLVVVIRSKIPEAEARTAQALVHQLDQDHAHFLSAQDPSGLPFFDTEGLLFLPEAKLKPLLNRLISAQPLLGQLVTDPTGRGIFTALSLMALGLKHGGIDLTPYNTAFTAIHNTIAASLAGHPAPLSWLSLLSGPVAAQAGTSRIVLVRPKLDFTKLEPGAAATAALRKAALALPTVRDGLVTVGVTGQVALSDQQFASVAKGVVAGAIGTIVLVTLWLFLALRSWRIVLPVVLTLLLGLVLTSAFAAAAVGQLNLVSVAFAILFVGLAVDFSIQFAVRFREHRHRHNEREALAKTAATAGRQILLAALGTAAGFLAFVPTQFQGVAELGLIAGVGMLIAFLCTIIFLPAAISFFRAPGEPGDIGFAALGRLERRAAPYARVILGVCAALTVAGLVVLPRIVFDGDPLDTMNPRSEAVVELRRLMENPLTNPYSAEVLARNVPAAAKLAAALRGAPGVGTVLSVQSFVPTDQAPKLAMIADASEILAPTLSANSRTTPVTAPELRLALKTALGSFAEVQPKLGPDTPFAKLAGDLKALAAAPDSTLLATSEALTRFLPDQLANLRKALSAEPVTLAGLPPEITRDWVLPDGRARVQAIAEPGNRSSQGLARFVAAVSRIAPGAAGPAVNVVGSAHVIVNAFRTAAIGALIAIAIILGLALRRPKDVALVMAPLLLSGLITALAIVALPLPLNFANIIALPLLLGVGVSFNVYFVMNWRDGARRFLGTPTARAILFSALTTGTAFGSLALSADRGTASMGELLLISLAATLLATFIFVPALLLTLTPEQRKAPSHADGVLITSKSDSGDDPRRRR
ncbi:MAG: MMPL family transporter [Acetobacteraceae bacterium]